MPYFPARASLDAGNDVLIGTIMALEPGDNDFIARIRQRHQVAPAPAPKPSRTFIVKITRDGKTTEDLFFDQAPSIGAIAGRAGTEAFVLSIDMVHHREDEKLAAE